MTITSIEAIHAHLDEHPDDWEARLGLADWMEERGDLIGAEGQRWQVEHRKRPDDEWEKDQGHWNWFDASVDADDCEPPTQTSLEGSYPYAFLPGRLFAAGRLYERFKTRQAAERALAERLHELAQDGAER